MDTTGTDEGYPPDLGAQLSKIRLAARLNQSDVAQQVGVDQSRISRIEKGDVTPTASEITRILSGVKSADSLNYLKYLEKSWRNIDRPSFSNPQSDVLYTADAYLSKLEEFRKSHDLPSPLVAEMDMHRESLLRAADYLNQRSHDIAFLGDIAVGKTTALCFISGMVLPGSGAVLDKVVLEAGAGGITICEVQIRKGPGYGITVDPQPDAEIYRSAEELCEGLWAKRSGNVDDEENSKGVSREVDRALRNMAGLPRRRVKDENGKRVTIDEALDLANECTSLHEFQSSFSEGLRLWERTTRKIWHSPTDGSSPIPWLQKVFTDINNGRSSDISLPRVIDIVIPDDVLDESTFSLSLVDTNGVDQTAVRPDLENRLRDPRTLTVLCSRFNEAPGPTMQRFLEHARDTLPEGVFRERVLLMVLPRPDEACAMKYDTGEMVESDEEGYDLKRDQAQATLRRIGVGELPIAFFNATSDAPEAARACLVGRINDIRSGYSKRVRSVCEAIDRLIDNHEVVAAHAAQNVVRRRLTIFCDQHSALPDRKRPLHEELVKAFRTLNARTVWATTRRRGGWYNLDVFFHLGRGGAVDANLRSRSAIDGLNELIANMLGDDGLTSTHEFLRELQENVEEWRHAFVERARAVGEETFRSDLSDDGEFWVRCEERWGQGAGYRDDVTEMVKDWFEASEREHLHSSAERKIRSGWRNHVIKPLRRLID